MIGRGAFQNSENLFSGSVSRKKDSDFSFTITNFLLLIILGGLGYLFFLSNVFTIKAIFVEGEKQVQKDDIKKIAEGFLGQDTNIFLFRTGKVREKILSQIPEISDLRIYRGLPNALKIIVVEREGVLIWETGGESYVVDEQGTAFKKAEGKEDLPKIIDANNVPIRVGDKILTTQFSEFARVIARDFKSKTGLGIKSLEIIESTFELHIVTEKGFKILFDTSRPADIQLEVLAKILPKISDQVKEYIDLRVEGWAYYR